MNSDDRTTIGPVTGSGDGGHGRPGGRAARRAAAQRHQARGRRGRRRGGFVPVTAVVAAVAGTGLLAALAGLTADVAVLLADSGGDAAAVVGTLGGFFLLVLVLQTFRPSDPKERFYALTVLGSATVVTALCTALLLADWVPAGVGAVALATLLAAAPLPGPKQLGPVLGLVAAVLLGFLVGAPVALGALAGLGALIGRRVAAYDFPSRFVHMTAGVALPLAVAAPLIWMATDLLAG